jgi:hypothetical protein
VVLNHSAVPKACADFQRRNVPVGVILLLLLLALILGGLGFAVHVLWIVAVIVFVLWLLALVLGHGRSAGARTGWW